MRDATAGDHVAAIRDVLERMESHFDGAILDDIEPHLNALATERDRAIAERDALRAYARALEDHRGSDIYGEACPSDTEIARIRAEHGVSDLMDTDP